MTEGVYPLSCRETSVDIDIALAALALTETPEEARKIIQQQGRDATLPALAFIAREHQERLMQLREDLLVGGLTTNAQIAQKAASTAIALAQKRLDAGMIDDPTRAARDLTEVAAKSLEKKLTLEGRPQSIREVHTVEEIFGRLERYGVVDSTAEDDD